MPGLTSQISMRTLYTDFSIGNMRDQDFEFIILESALDNIVSKFKKLNFPKITSTLLIVIITNYKTLKTELEI